MRTIGVIIPTFTIEYSLDVLAGISDFFRGTDARVLIAQTNYLHSADGTSDYQYWSSVEYLKSDEVDAVIVVSGLYASSMQSEALSDVIAAFAPKPVISIAVDFNLDNVGAILLDCKKSYCEVVSHLKDVHGCKRIAFMSANLTGSAEAGGRFAAFKNAMQVNSLEVRPELVFDGNFTDVSAVQAVSAKIKSRDDLDFDAMVCANDLMACGVMNYFASIGIKVPDDVRIIGFDDSIAASIASPRLSTINQDIYELGRKSAQIALDAADNGIADKIIYIDAEPKYRQSCGCVPLSDSEHVFKNQNCELMADKNERMDNFPRFMNEISEKNNIVSIIDILQGANTLKQIFYSMRYIIRHCDISGICINFFYEERFLEPADDFAVPEEVELYMLTDDKKGVELFMPEISFNPAKKLFASRSSENEPGIYIFQPIFSGEANYGFLICRINGVKFADYNVYLKIISTGLVRAFDYTRKLRENQHLAHELTALTIQSVTDELTGIMNRRGFMESGQSCLDIISVTGECGVVFFADMDGLKKINDTYGHDIGDLAIKTQAEVLKEIFGKSAIVGRLSGDEFGIIAVGMPLSAVKRIHLKIDLLNEKYSAKNGLPFVISTSLGYVELQNSSRLNDLLLMADQSLYEEKHIKHG